MQEAAMVEQACAQLHEDSEYAESEWEAAEAEEEVPEEDLF